MTPVTGKHQMYALLAGGAFGNTISMYFSVGEWERDAPDLPFWGVRTLTPGGPCVLNCDKRDVKAIAEIYQAQGHTVNISAMISSVGQVTWLGDVWDGPFGIECNGIENPPRVHNWRALMKTPTRWQGVLARQLLQKHLNANSYADLELLFELYPDHVYELSALDRCFGTVPGRNAIIWEVRGY